MHQIVKKLFINMYVTLLMNSTSEKYKNFRGPSLGAILLHLKLSIWPLWIQSESSAEPDADRFAGHNQDRRGRPARRHRNPDPQHDHGVHLQGQLSDSSRVAGQLGPGQLGRAQTGQGGGSVRKTNHWYVNLLYVL